ncbi:energy-coupling factor ABC transporter ATP-binding protein [Peribacillus butanolivorans]|uniref:energy-coupling factor ABC transporter ATP-binding protein n=2 Tax=Peribacillus butanolivorans TaxID=421767 RepID=UPI00167FB59B|nr:ABC transporter ATP-binding protein [Peribacillus butanolivorans]QNU03822.1 ABC transporter ATP-binding protein [Peribacillus butanolivorans]
MGAIELKDVTFAYPNGYIANENLHLTIESGERVAIVGQNGAGKTTAVKLMNGLNKPTKGDVLVNGINTKENTTARISAQVGYVFQNPDDQIFNSNVKKEIEYMLHYLKLDKKEIDRRVNRAVELTGIRDYLEMNPYDVPYSTRKFISVAAILAIETPYIILDEPTAGQDLNGIKTLTTLMDVLRDEGKSVITITHDMEFVADNFSRVVAMANKRIIADGTAREIFWNQEVVKQAKIKKTQIAELANELGVGSDVLFRNELVELLTNKVLSVEKSS